MLRSLGLRIWEAKRTPKISEGREMIRVPCEINGVPFATAFGWRAALDLEVQMFGEPPKPGERRVLSIFLNYDQFPDRASFDAADREFRIEGDSQIQLHKVQQERKRRNAAR